MGCAAAGDGNLGFQLITERQRCSGSRAMRPAPMPSSTQWPRPDRLPGKRVHLLSCAGHTVHHTVAEQLAKAVHAAWRVSALQPAGRHLVRDEAQAAVAPLICTAAHGLEEHVDHRVRMSAVAARDRRLRRTQRRRELHASKLGLSLFNAHPDLHRAFTRARRSGYVRRVPLQVLRERRTQAPHLGARA